MTTKGLQFKIAIVTNLAAARLAMDVVRSRIIRSSSSSHDDDDAVVMLVHCTILASVSVCACAVDLFSVWKTPDFAKKIIFR